MSKLCADKYRWKDFNNPYHYRDDNLRVLGFASYRAYLQSALWQSIRQRVLEQMPLCCRCGGRATVVHHRSYDPATLRGDNLNSLSPFCRTHHRRAESQRLESKETSYMKLRNANTYALRHTACHTNPSTPRQRSSALGMAPVPKLVKRS